MLEALKEEVFEANQLLPRYNLVSFTWGSSVIAAVQNAAVLEEVAFTAWHCLDLPDKYLVPMQKDLLERHYSKNHGKQASYGLFENDELPS